MHWSMNAEDKDRLQRLWERKYIFNQMLNDDDERWLLRKMYALMDEVDAVKEALAAAIGVLEAAR